jgi:predicted HTH domain antitoxin
MDQETVFADFSGGKLCSAAAAHLLAMPHSRFLQMLKDRGFVVLPLDEEALQQELEAIYLRQQNGPPGPK